MRLLATLISLVFLLLGAAGASAQPAFTSVDGDEKDGRVVISWSIDDGSQVRHFLVYVETEYTNGEKCLNEASPVRTNSDNVYEYVDESLFKTGSQQATYFVSMVLTNGTTVSSEKVNVNYTSTAVRRTWGSIKAMFQ